MRRLSLFLTTSAFALGFIGCSGSSQNISPTIPAATTASVTFRIVVPHHLPQDVRPRPQYVSPSTQRAVITDTTSSGSVQYNTFCTTVCTAQITVPIGVNTFSISLEDIYGNLLSSGTTTATIVPGKVNKVSVTFDPVVQSAALPLLSAPSGQAQSVPVIVNAIDPDGNTIVGPGVFRTKSGKAVTITMTDSDPSGHSRLSKRTTTGPDDVVDLKYDGSPHATSILTATANGIPAVASGSFASLSNPRVSAWIGSQEPAMATIGSDGNLWIAASARIGLDVVKLTGNGMQELHNVRFRGQIGGETPEGITKGPDGNIWITTGIDASAAVVKMTTDGVATKFSDPRFTFLHGITAGPDGNLWIADRMAGCIDRMTIAGMVSVFPTDTNPSRPNWPEEVAFGSDGRLYYTENAYEQIDKFNISSHGHIHIHLPPGVKAFTLTRGSDGNVYFSGANSRGSSVIGYVTSSGAAKVFAPPQGLNVTGQPVVGADGQLWFVDAAFGIRWITATGQVGGYAIPVSPNGGINMIASAADGSFWVATYNEHGVAGLTHLAF